MRFHSMATFYSYIMEKQKRVILQIGFTKQWTSF
ncbi:hypothetical protein Patl1_14523 [Pistacia atlantica]|uniref:Uncharacterized protein n=1 Tax=Pistacia atlantica TaxID=434234 RepID=A0ACC1ASE1_9ROSI|nr:hypothetical protein Patl1_14523 [Pistacia atlantica]